MHSKNENNLNDALSPNSIFFSSHISVGYTVSLHKLINEETMTEKCINCKKESRIGSSIPFEITENRRRNIPKTSVC